MYEFFLIFFREFLEVSLVTGVLAASLTGYRYKNQIIAKGVFFGFLLSIASSLIYLKLINFIAYINSDITNFVILATSSALIGWTVIWMSSHGRNLATKLKTKAQELKEGKTAFNAVIIVIALSIFREGVEMILFSHGVIVSSANEPLANFIIGGFFGAFVATLFGYGIYIGIVKFPTKYIFKFLAILMSFLSAGLLIQSLKFLESAGVIQMNLEPLWDSSFLVAKSSLIGSLLSALIGYIPNPNLFELSLYILTIVSIQLLSNIYTRNLTR